MDLTLLSTGLPDLLPSRDRTPGTHLKSIITDMCIRLGYYDRDRELDPSLLQLGLAMEWAIVERYRRHFPGHVVIGEIECDGVYGHPDLLYLPNRIVKEFKYTERSSGHVECGIGCTPPDDHPIRSKKFWPDWTQLAGYTYMMDRICGRSGREWREGHLEICHVRGNYKVRRVVYNAWGRPLTLSELESNWRMLMDHAGDWACKGCGQFEHEGHVEGCRLIKSNSE